MNPEPRMFVRCPPTDIDVAEIIAVEDVGDGAIVHVRNGGQFPVTDTRDVVVDRIVDAYRDAANDFT